MVKLKRLYLFMLIVLAVGILGACNDTEVKEEDTEKVVPVEVADVEKGNLTITKTVYGRLEPSSTTPVMPQNPGEIDTLEVADGDDVKKDDDIATIISPAGVESINARSDGTITNLDVEEGDVASDEEPLAVIADLDTMKLTFNVTAKVRNLFQTDDEHQSVIDEKKYDATITRVKEMPDDTGLYPVEATVKNKKGKLLPGMVARLDVPEKKVKNTIIVPTSAIVTEEGESIVFVLQDNTVRKIDVTITETQSEETAIKGDVEPGDQIVINGQLTLTDGSMVDVTNEENES